jgi:hypothetical protein
MMVGLVSQVVTLGVFGAMAADGKSQLLGLVISLAGGVLNSSRDTPSAMSQGSWNIHFRSYLKEVC